MRAKLVLCAGVTLLALTLGPVGVAAAKGDGPGGEASARRGACVYGVIEAVEGQSWTLATPIGSVTVVTDVNTRFRIPEVDEPGPEDVEVGDYLGATGWWEKEGNTFHVFGVTQVETAHIFPLAGELTDIGADTLTVETARGRAAVSVDDETVVHIRGEEGALGLDGLEVGMRVVVRGTLKPDGSLLARAVAVPWVGPRPIQLRGEVLAVGEGEFTVRAARGRQFPVQTDQATEFLVPGVVEIHDFF